MKYTSKEYLEFLEGSFQIPKGGGLKLTFLPSKMGSFLYVKSGVLLWSNLECFWDLFFHLNSNHFFGCVFSSDLVSCMNRFINLS